MNFDRRLARTVPVAAIAGALGAVLLLGPPSSTRVTAQDTAKMTQEQRLAATALEGAFMTVAETVEPATVHITSRTTPPAPRRSGGSEQNPERDGGDDDLPFGLDDLFRRFPSLPRGPQLRQASGSGVIVRADGYILTNDHLVANADNNTVRVTLSDGRQFTGKVIRDFRSDLALVKIDAGRPLPFVHMADSEKVHVGQWAIAIGSPFGLQRSMTAGIVSALQRRTPIGMGRQERYYPNLIQTDASINPGNSGGPLLNINGELIGINVAIESPTGTSAGIGFAIPANTARTIMEQLITKGKVTRGYLGLQPDDIPAGLRGSRLGTDKGAYVIAVSPDTPAQRAGIHAGDVITRFGDRTISGELDLREAIAATAPSTRVPVTVLRVGETGTQTRTLEVVVGALPGEETVAAAPAPARAESRLGFRSQTLSPALAREMKLDAGVRGVVVGEVETGSAAAEAGLFSRDLITAINGKPAATVEALNRAVAAARSGDLITLTVLRFAGNEDKPGEAVVNITVP